MPPRGWWNSRWFCILLVIVTTIPLLYPSIPPFTDLPGHMGRYRVELSDPASPLRSLYYDFHWRFLANLGVDIAIIPMAKLFGLELGLKLIVIAIPAMVVFGILWIAREAHGRVPPPALFALPLAYGFPLIWGFLNFSFAMALALNAFALWLRLGRIKRYRLRDAIFVPIGLLLTVAHVFGWAVLCLLCYAAEVVRARDEGRPFFASFFWGGVNAIALAPPLVLLLVWRSGDANAKSLTGDFFYWHSKYVYVVSAVRTHWMNYDIDSVYFLVGLVALALIGIWVRMNRTLGIASLMLMIAYCLLPRMLLNSAYADMRLAPYVIMIAVTAVTLRSSSRRQAAIVAGIATAMFAARLAMLTASFAEHDDANRAQLVALDHVRPGSRVFVEVALQCLGRWETTRMDHLGAMAIVRRGAFANGQWVDPGAQLLSVKYAPAKGFAEDPTQILRPYPCRQGHAKTYPAGLNHLPHDAFDYVWLIAMDRERMNSFPGLTPIWIGNRGGILYRVDHDTPPEAPTPPL